jgi:signal transduction histidine kinase
MDRSDAASHQVATLTGAAVICVALFVVFSVILLYLFFNRLFAPLRDLTSRARLLAADRYGISPEVPTDELKALHYYMTQIVTAFTDADARRESNGISSSINDDSATSLAAAVAHEIRSPLTAMKMLLFSLQKSVSDTPSLQNKLAVLAREVTRLETMSRGFLAVSRPAEPRCAPHQLSVLVQQVTDLFQHSLESRGIRLQTHLEADLPLIWADAAHVTQVIVNLLTNALEASRDGGTIWLSATQACGDEGAARVILRIRDEGAGVPSEAAARVFEPYFTTKARGTGLGLAIAKSLISRYSGKLVLESSSAEGSTFSVWIPATPACHG